MTSRTSAAPTEPSRLGWAGIAALCAYFYVVAVGGTDAGLLDPATRGLNAAIAAVLLFHYLRGMPSHGDAIDRRILLAFIVFSVAGVLAVAPRQAFDSILLAGAFAAALFAARHLSSRPALRRAFVPLSMGLFLLMMTIISVRWIPQVVGIVGAAGGIAPPLNLELSAFPWGHRYDVTLLALMLYPAWWMGVTSMARRIAAGAAGTWLALVVIVVGSRTLWAAVAVACLAIAIPPASRLWTAAPSRVRVAAVLGGLLILAGLLLTGPGAAITQRMFSSASLGFRTAMWGPLFEVWAAHPIAGYGAGSFPWLLQLTPYFDANSFAPRHPDNALVQLLAEGGILGVLSLLVVAAGLVPPLLR